MRVLGSLRPSTAGALLAVWLLGAVPARAGDVTLFASRTSPTEAWDTGWGAALSTTWFRLLQIEGEAARVPGALEQDTMTTFTAGAFLAPSIGPLTPYGGIGLGFFRQGRGDQHDTGWLNAFALGAKLRLGVVVLRGEWRELSLSGDALFPADKRISAGIGIAF
jgi:hypothetical protein